MSDTNLAGGWVGEGTDHGLRDALATWFGPGSAPGSEIIAITP